MTTGRSELRVWYRMEQRNHATSEVDLIPGFHAVEWVRAVRDAQAAELAGKSDAEVIAYYRQAAETARAKARRWMAAHDR